MGVFQIMADEEDHSMSEEDNSQEDNSQGEWSEPSSSDGEQFTVFFSVVRHGIERYLNERFTFGPKSEALLLIVNQRDSLVCFQHPITQAYLMYTDRFLWGDRPNLFVITLGGPPEGPVTCRDYHTNQALTCKDGRLAWNEQGGVLLKLAHTPSPTFLQQSKEFLGRQRNTIVLIVLIGLLVLVFLIQA